MSIDIVPELLEKIEKDFRAKMNGSPEVRGLFFKIKLGKATYKDAQKYAVLVGGIMSECLNLHISSDTLPDGKMYYNIADRIFNQTLGKNGTYGYISHYAQEVQGIINKNAGIGIKAIKAELNQDRIDGIVNIVSGKNHYDDIKYMTKEPIINFGQAIVDDTVKANVDFQGKTGLKPKIVRTSATPCEWCDKLQGTYVYPDVPEDVYRRHKHCRCLVTYQAEGKRPENVHTKKYLTDEEIEKRRTVGLETPLKKDSHSIIQKAAETEGINAAKASKSIENQIKNDIIKSENTTSPRGKKRAEKYSQNWAKQSLKETIDKFIPQPLIKEHTSTGKFVYSSSKSHFKIIYDISGDYFRIEDTRIQGKRKYVDIDGQNAANVKENGKERGRTTVEYQAVTHFKNLD